MLSGPWQSSSGSERASAPGFSESQSSKGRDWANSKTSQPLPHSPRSHRLPGVKALLPSLESEQPGSITSVLWSSFLGHHLALEKREDLRPQQSTYTFSVALVTPLSRSRKWGHLSLEKSEGLRPQQGTYTFPSGPSCQVCTLLHSSDPRLLLPSYPPPSLLVWARLFQKLGRVGEGTKGWVFFLAPTPPWVLGAESFLVSSLERGTKPSPAWPQSGHSWECVSLVTGWCGGDVLSLCVCVTGLCLCCLQICLCLWACVFWCLFVPFLVFTDLCMQMGCG